MRPRSLCTLVAFTTSLGLTGAANATTTPKSINLAELAADYHARGMNDLWAGLYSEGEANIRKAVSFASKASGSSDPRTAAWEIDLGLALHLEGRDDRALEVLERARAVLEAHPDGDNCPLGTELAVASAIEIQMNKFTQAENDAGRALAIFNAHFPAGGAEVARAQVNLAAIYLVEYRTADAAAILPDAVAAERRILPGSRALANGIRFLGRLRAQQHRWTEADSLYREAMAMFDAEAGSAQTGAVAVRHELAEVLRHENAKTAALRPPPPA